MKRHVIFMALLCLLFVFQSVMAVPQVRSDLVYNGEMQQLASDPNHEGGFYAIGSEDYWEEIPEEDIPGEWDIYWKAAEEDAGKFIGKAKISAKEIKVEWGETTLEYTWEEQAPSVTLTGCVAADADLCENPEVDGAAYDAGEYEATLFFDSDLYFIPEASRSVKFEIKPKELSVEWGQTTLSYNGEEQIPQVTVTGCAGEEADLCENPIVDGYEFDAGTYEAVLSIDSDNYTLPEGTGSAEFEITPIKLDVNWGDTKLEYTGDEQAPQVTLSGCVEADADLCANPEVDGAEFDAGTYEASLYLDSVNYVVSEDTAAASYEIAPKELESSMIIFDDSDYFIYDGEQHEISFYVEYNGIELTEGTDYVVDEKSVFSGTELGEYTVSITAVGEGAKDVAPGNFSGSTSKAWSILAQAPAAGQATAPDQSSASDQGQTADVPEAEVGPAAETAPARAGIPVSSQAQTQSYADNIPFTLYRIGEEEKHVSSFCYNCELPKTGFSSRVSTPLSVKPAGLEYTDLKMRIQIPVIGLDTELAGVPLRDSEWAVEWLGDRAGVLSGSYAPGEGLTVVAAHNTLSETETGPFLLLFALEHNDVIFINQPDDSLQRFGVYANLLVEPNDMQKLALIAEQEEGSLLLVTCENESVEGGYLNRRVVFAKPLD